jgi:hypothetical protein
MIPPVPTKEANRIIPPVPTETEVVKIAPVADKADTHTISPALITTAASTNPKKPTAHKLKGTLQAYWRAVPSRDSCCPNNGSKKEYVSYCVELIGLHYDSKRIMDDNMKMLVHNERSMGNKAVAIF